jgi:hypothetical protein
MGNLRPDKDFTRLHPELSHRIKSLLHDARKQSLSVALFEGWRSVPRQNYLYEKGKSTLQGKRGLHTHGMAADIVFTDKKGHWTWKAPAASWKKLGSIGEKYGLEWGGRWKKFVDKPHFQLNKLDRAALKLMPLTPPTKFNRVFPLPSQSMLQTHRPAMATSSLRSMVNVLSKPTWSSRSILQTHRHARPSALRSMSRGLRR